jgi:CBS domain-containing protein
MNTVKQLLKAKDSTIFTISPDASVFSGLELMARNNVGALLITENDRLVGIFSERDYARNVFLKGKSSKGTSIGEVMVRNVIYVTLGDDVESCMALMTDKRIRHLPVLENEQLVGVVSIGDVVKQIISEQEFAIRELEKYIQGSY